MRPFVGLLIGAAALAWTFGTSAQQPQAVRPNILIIQADDLGYGDVGVYGQKRFETPSLDRLAHEGMRFTNYYAGSTVCAPSRNALMTGQHTGHVWIRGNAKVALRPEDVTIASLLRDAGYRTALVGKWGLGNADTTGQPDKKGFDYSFGFLDQSHAHRQFPDHLYRNAKVYPTDPAKDYANDLFTRESLAFIDAADARPFFLYLNYTVPHAELRAPDEAMQPFAGKFPEKPFVNAQADARAASGPDDTVSLGYRSQPTPHAAFAAMITRMDRDIGRILDDIKAHGFDRRTLIFFMSDNGPHVEGGADPAFFNSAGGLRGVKRDLYEGGIRVPMIVRWTGTVPPGRVSDHPWAHWDMLPTVAEITGIRAPKNIDGFSMVRALKGVKQPSHDFFYWEFHERGFQQAVRMGNWKAVRLGKDQPLELYNLRTDPSEKTNVAAQQPKIVARIEKYLKTARTDSPNFPVK
jgi:arylsulfatase A